MKSIRNSILREHHIIFSWNVSFFIDRHNTSKWCQHSAFNFKHHNQVCHDCQMPRQKWKLCFIEHGVNDIGLNCWDILLSKQTLVAIQFCLSRWTDAFTLQLSCARPPNSLEHNPHWLFRESNSSMGKRVNNIEEIEQSLVKPMQSGF